MDHHGHEHDGHDVSPQLGVYHQRCHWRYPLGYGSISCLGFVAENTNLCKLYDSFRVTYPAGDF
ncbi:hypothetical protein OUZ56_026061 [Daphnia magna]|uniref:Uncharacterized protein n=1 Tax=Daphnia magna TaxID=35525 RepID=A0ABQ9ZKQ4_9CRUS|nr:hypothetical protein OUZ56_026061 [Daphnia magna]